MPGPAVRGGYAEDVRLTVTTGLMTFASPSGTVEIPTHDEAVFERGWGVGSRRFDGVRMLMQTVPSTAQRRMFAACDAGDSA